MTEWIETKDGLPDPNVMVILYVKLPNDPEGFLLMGNITKGGFWELNQLDGEHKLPSPMFVTHWTPCPVFPHEED